jgi:two-component system chemotaxis response regulator CheY
MDMTMSGHRKTFLIADDSRVVRSVARDVLSDLGFDIDEAENGEVALQLCKNVLPDAILLDWNMPVMDGLTFLKNLRSLPGGTIPTVIFCTTDGEMTSIQTALESGADEYIMKPFTAEIIRDKLEGIGLIQQRYDDEAA